MIENIPDVSRWQGNIDEDVMLSRGIPGLNIRLGSINKSTGECYTDYLFYENHAKFAHEVPCGYYWYFRPKWGGKKQAEFVIKILREESIIPNMPIWLDVECNGVSLSEFAKQISAFRNTIRAADYKYGTYTRGYFWNDYVGIIPEISEDPLWIARYSESAVHPWNNNILSKLRPYPWQYFTLWQWSADGNGMGDYYGCDCDDLDLNRGNFVTLEEFHKWANWKQEDPTEPPGCLMTIINLVRKEK